MTEPSTRRALAAALVLAASWPCHAGQDLETTLARHRALLGQQALESAARDVTWSLGTAASQIPRFTAPTIDRKGPAVRLRDTFELGAGTWRPRAKLSLTLGPTGSATASLEGSSLSLPTGDTGELYAAIERRHWGPAWSGSLILDGAAAPMATLGWRKQDDSAPSSPLFSWLGPWQLDVFAGQLTEYTRPARPWLIGMRLQAEPLQGLQIGLSRALQWGGEGRPQGLKSLLDGLLGRDNADAGNSAAAQPGNQLAGLDVRYQHTLAGGIAIAGYAQAIGEDEANGLPTAFLALLGADLAMRHRSGDWRFYAEWANTIAGDVVGRAQPGTAYTHHIYGQGYTHVGRPLGYPVGGDVRIASLGALVDSGPLGASIGMHAGRSGAQAQRHPARSRLAGLDASAMWRLAARDRIGVSLWAWHLGERKHHDLQVWWQHAWP